MAIQALPKKTLRLVIHVRMHVVFFCYSMHRAAQHLPVAGWLRNRSDSAVEVAVHGDGQMRTLLVDCIGLWFFPLPTAKYGKITAAHLEPDQPFSR